MEGTGSHSPLGASSMHRVSKCPASVKRSEGLPSVESVAAIRGTNAHETLAFAMEDAFNDNVSTKAVLWKYVKHLLVHANYIEKIKDEGDPVHIEHEFDMTDLHPLFWGTSDTIVYKKKRKLLEVVDFKYGEGLPVEVKDNIQLRYYALGAIRSLGYHVKQVKMTIVQPRCYHPDGPIRSWQVHVMDIWDFQEDLLEWAKATEKKKPKAKAGGHCIFCPARDACKDRQDKTDKRGLKFYRDPKKDFSPIEDTTDFKSVGEDCTDEIFNF
jgi:hypothetical protein